MTLYRLYKFRDDGRVSGPPHVIDCRDDEAAMREAHQLARGHVREVWDLARFVGRIDLAFKRRDFEIPPTSDSVGSRVAMTATKANRQWADDFQLVKALRVFQRGARKAARREPSFNFNVEEWDAEGLNYETLAICRTLALARPVFAVAVGEKPAGRFIIRSRTRVVQRHPEGDW